jgi:hypothetical protein
LKRKTARTEVLKQQKRLTFDRVLVIDLHVLVVQLAQRDDLDVVAPL